MKLLCIVGSLKKESNNRKIIDHLIDKYGDQHQMKLGDISGLPMYNEDIEGEDFPAVEALREDIRWADGLIVITPEHNGSITAVLKNALDWMSRVDRVMINKPLMIISSSLSPLGGVRAQGHLREILHGMGLSALVEPGVESLIGSIHEKLDDQGRLIDQATLDHLEARMENFEAWIRKFQ